VDYQHLKVERRGAVEHVMLNRPDVRNAFNEALIADLRRWADGLDGMAVRVAVLSGAGRTFSAGGDLNWMERASRFSREENIADATALAEMFGTLDRLPVPLIGRIHGAAMGGGAGLAAVCDIVVAAEDAVFSLTEVRLGLVPSVISPYVLAKIGRSPARELFLTGARFGAARAREIGLVHKVVGPEELDGAVQEYVAAILASGPGAVSAAKALIPAVWEADPAEARRMTIEAIADRRGSDEGREGIRAFLEKRKPGFAVGRVGEE
jgi:methylglutaconyl-CoA hydratase